MKKDAGYYDERQARGKDDRIDLLAQEDDAWVVTRNKEIRDFKIAVVKLNHFICQNLDLTEEVAKHFVKLAENAAHEASKLQKTLEKGNKI